MNWNSIPGYRKVNHDLLWLFAKSLTPIVLISVLLVGCKSVHLHHSSALLKTKHLRLTDSVSIDLTYIPAGSFWMGQRAGEKDAYPNKEQPQHEVTLTSGFWMGQYEVTQQQWFAVMGTRPWLGQKYAHNDPLSPAVYLSWKDAKAFVEKLSRMTQLTFRLPTEAEWEYSCRAGTQTRFYWGDDLDYQEINLHAWWRGNSLISAEPYAHRGGHFPPNPWGLYDMSGNVSEWCEDWHAYYPAGKAIDPQGATKAEHRVLRGGSWTCIGGYCRSARRYHELPEMAHGDFGFRVVMQESSGIQQTTPFQLNLFTAGTEGVNTYRIPSLLLAPNNTLLAFCEARKFSISDASPTDLILKRSIDGGEHWLPTQTLLRGMGNQAFMNPCPVVDRINNTIYLFAIDANAIAPNQNRQVMLTSTDNGENWSEPIDLKERINRYDNSLTFGPGIGIQLQSGRLVIPGYIGSADEELDEQFYSCALYSDDHGKSWTLSKTVGELSDESQAVELQDGSVMLNFRGNMGTSCRGVAISKDGGESWGKVYWDHQLNECPCQASILRYSLGKSPLNRSRILFCNPDNSGERFGILERSRLTLRMSYDEGRTWPVKRLIHDGPSSYSAMVKLPDGAIGLLFEGGDTHRREWIRFMKFPIGWLTDGLDQQ